MSVCNATSAQPARLPPSDGAPSAGARYLYSTVSCQASKRNLQIHCIRCHSMFFEARTQVCVSMSRSNVFWESGKGYS